MQIDFTPKITAFPPSAEKFTLFLRSHSATGLVTTPIIPATLMKKRRNCSGEYAAVRVKSKKL